MTGSHRFASWLFHKVCVKDYAAPSYEHEDFEDDLASSKRFFARFGGTLAVDGKTVLDVGCGTGSTCVEATLRGARRVVGVDTQRVRIGREEVARNYAHLADRIEFLQTDGTLRELGDERFDVVLSKDSFEHYARPEAFVSVLTRFLAREGHLAIGFGPLWKSPTGGHIGFMTNFPWAHLIFPESVIMDERRRFRPDEDARRFEEIKGGLNKMTLARFSKIMESTGLECVYFATNVSAHPVVRLMKLVSHAPFAREYFTANVYSVWRPPPVSSSAAH